MSGLHKVCVWHYDEQVLVSEYAMVLNMLELHMVLNKILHNRYLTGFWICLEFRICQCYTGFCRKVSIIHVWQSFNNHSILNGILNGIFGILNVLGSEYAKVLNLSGVQICKCPNKVTKGSEKNTLLYIFDRVLNIPRFQNMPRFWIY